MRRTLVTLLLVIVYLYLLSEFFPGYLVLFAFLPEHDLRIVSALLRVLLGTGSLISPPLGPTSNLGELVLLWLGLAAVIALVGDLAAALLTQRATWFRRWTDAQGEWRLLIYRAAYTSMAWAALVALYDWRTAHSNPFSAFWASRGGMFTFFAFLLIPLGGLLGLLSRNPRPDALPPFTLLSREEQGRILDYMQRQRQERTAEVPLAPVVPKNQRLKRRLALGLAAVALAMVLLAWMVRHRQR